DLTSEVGESDVEDAAAVLEDPEQQRGEQDAERVVARQQRDGDTVEAVTSWYRLTQRVVLEGATEYVVRGSESGQAATDGHRHDGVAAQVRPAVLGCSRSQADGPQFVAPARAEQEHVGRARCDQGDEERRVEVGGWDSGR